MPCYITTENVTFLLSQDTFRLYNIKKRNLESPHTKKFCQISYCIKRLVQKRLALSCIFLTIIPCKGKTLKTNRTIETSKKIDENTKTYPPPKTQVRLPQNTSTFYLKRKCV